MKIKVAATVFFLWAFFADPGYALMVQIPVSKGSPLEKELGYTINTQLNENKSELEGTVTFSFRAPRTQSLQHLSRMFLRLNSEKERVAILPLELDLQKSGEVRCHFHLTPQMIKGSILELICPVPNMPNGQVYQIKLAEYWSSER